MTRADARKREAERAERAAQDAQEIAQAPSGPSVAPESTDDANGAQIANLGTVEIHALLEALLTDEYGEQGWNDLGSLRRLARFLNARFATVVREHRAEVLAEVERVVAGRREAFLASPNLDPAWIAGWHSAVDDVTKSVHAARQEQNRD